MLSIFFINYKIKDNGEKDMGGKGSGRKRKYNDSLHEYWRKASARYVEKHREAWNLANREKISVTEARRRVEGKKRSKKK